MIRNRFLRLASTVALVLVSSSVSAQNYGNGLIDKSVAIVGNEVIMISNIETEAQMMKARGIAVDSKARCEIFENYMTAKLFLVQARLDSLSVNDANVVASLDQKINETMAVLGGEKETEAYFGKPMYKLRQEWEEMIREQSLIQSMQQNVTQDIPKLTPKDVKKFYEDVPEEDLPMVSTKYRLRQICVYPDREAAEIAVRERLIGIRERIVNGERFAMLARLYSQDPGTMAKGGELGMASKNLYWAPFSDAAMALKEGQVSQIVQTPDGFHIIQLIERKGDMFNARHILLKPQYSSEDREKGFRRLDSIRNLISEEKISFYYAARMYSEERRSATSGGLMSDEYTGSSYFEKDQLKPADYTVLKNMEEGDISEPFESLDNEGRNGNTIYKILLLEKILPAHPANFEDDFTELLEDANTKNAAEAIDKFIKEKIKTTYIVIDPLFQGCNFKYEGWGK